MKPVGAQYLSAPTTLLLCPLLRSTWFLLLTSDPADALS